METFQLEKKNLKLITSLFKLVSFRELICRSLHLENNFYTRFPKKW